MLLNKSLTNLFSTLYCTEEPELFVDALASDFETESPKVFEFPLVADEPSVLELPLVVEVDSVSD